ncbi:MFS transporter [Salipiger mangrovisoli]|uniref:MFS transporter n=1 Tax=Salipiger mangrovisoli TaxID=2865933 RepID=A0ABR9X8I2_9RHOB|nr:MFS transporter [Salipiger mangrovisoli]MBE9639863.1 MFS transporter [Salipiger mangrovisoli]
MRLPLSFAALFLSVILQQLSSGGVGPLDALSGFALNFTTAEIGFLGSAHFIGFFVGCWWAPRLMGSVGHSRAYAAFTAAGVIGLIAHPLLTTPEAWAIFRMATGLSVAGAYTVIEAWLQAEVTNETRGRAMAAYRMADMGAALVAQMLIGVLEPAHYVSYNLLALLCCAAMLPITLTRRAQPATPAAPRLRPGLAGARSPLAVAGVIVSALSGASFRMVGPIYGAGVGLQPDQIGLFLAAYIAGGAAAQYPVGWLADRFDRRTVLIWLSIGSILVSVATATLTDLSPAGVMLMAALFGVVTYPIYSVSAAHAHDFADNSERIELSATLMFWYAVGAIAAPYGAALLMAAFGPASLFALIGAGHVVLVIFGLVRMRARPAARRTPYVYAPRTSFTIGRLLSRQREGRD